MKTRHLHFLVTALLLLVTCARPSHAQSGCTITTPTYIGEDNRTYDSCDLVIEGTTVTMDGTHQFNSVTILNYGGLTHSACTVDAVHKLELEVTGTVTVDASSTIDVSGKGYLAGRTKGNTTEGGAEGSAGGSYGGQAGCDANGQCSNRAYGQYWEADEWGSGGGGPGGGTGGGLVRIRAGGMVLNGRVLAYGQNGVGDSGGGSGGGVDIRVTGAFEGAGHVEAFGGGGGSGSSGGRVVVEAQDRSGYAGVLRAYGAWPAGSAGTVYVRKAGEEYGTLMVDNAGFGPVSGAVEFVNEGPEKLVIGDAVVVKGYGRMLTRGLVEYGHDVSLELGGLWRVEGMGVGVSGSLTFSGRGEVEVVESLAVASEVAMSGGVLRGGRIQAAGMTLANNAVATSFGATTTAVHKLELEVTGTVTVDASSTIDVSGKGYLAGRTKGNTTEGGAEGSAGGSYGGQAGCDANGQCSNRAYGQYWEADEWGSGGGGPGGGTGGGLVRIRAGGMVLNGRVLAYGQNGVGDSGGGSGGGVDIRVTGAFEGAGHIQAFGGGGGSGSSGGRVVVVARERSGHAGVLQAYGAWPAGSAGTVYVRKAGEEYGTLMVDNAGFGPVSGAVEFVNEGPEKLVIGDAVVVKGYGRMLTRGLVEYGHDVSLELGGLWRVEGMGVGVSGSLTFSGRGEVEVVESLAVASEVAMSGGVLRGGRIQAAGMTLANNAVATSFGATTTAVHKLELEVTGTVTVDASSTIDVSGKGYLAGRTKGNTTEGGAEGSAGGSYGGQAGCDANGQCSNRAYGEYWEADEWGSGGGGPAGGAGGGLVRIKAGRMVVNGWVVASGQNGSGDSGGGSGGGIDIRVTGVFEGAGHVEAFGGGGGSGSSGGRVVVEAQDRSGYAGVLRAYGAWPAGSAGTVYVRKAGEEYGTLMVDNAGFGPVSGAVEFVNEGPEKLVIGDAVVVKGYGRMLTRGLVEYGHDVSLELGGLWRVEGMGVGVSGSLTFSGRGEVEVVESLAVASEVAMSGGVLRGGRIQAAGMTLANNAVATSFGATTTAVHKLELEVTGTVTVDASSTIDVSGKGYLAGRTKGNTTEGGAEGSAGGSYGGQAGCDANGQCSNRAYGQYWEADEWGSGGGGPGGGTGGGLVRIRAGGMVLNGRVLAYGQNGVGDSGGGSGGGVDIRVTGAFEGAGHIQAFGGGGGSGSSGGRVVVVARERSGHAGVLQAYGAWPAGSAGTVYVRKAGEEYGTLMVDNAGFGPVSGAVEFVNEGPEKLVIGDAVVVKGYGRMLTRGLVEYGHDVSLELGGLWRVEGPNTAIKADLTLLNGGQMEAAAVVAWEKPLLISGGVLVVDRLLVPDLELANAAVVTTFAPTISEVHKLELEVAGTLTVDASSAIDVSGKGYLAGRTLGNTSFGGSVGQAGGSYGGRGVVKEGRSNATYGYAPDPNDPGSGGSDALGGGVARIKANAVTLDGGLLANGITAGSGGGSGGGLFLETPLLAGSGYIQAAGGAAGSAAGGGGGRIALYIQDYSGFQTNNITATGAQGAEPGSIFFSQSSPTLHVIAHSPVGWNGGSMTSVIERATVQFNKPIDAASFTPAQFLIDGQMGRRSPTRITAIDDQTFEIAFAPLSEDGSYHFILLPAVRDHDGIALDQNANGIPGESTDDFNWDLRLDTVAPRITRHEPAGDVTGTLDSVDVWFSEAIEWPTFTPVDVAIKTPSETRLAATKVENVGLNRLRVSFPGQTELGVYSFTIGPDIQDLAGNVLDQNRDGQAGRPDDLYTFAVNLAPVDLRIQNVTANTNQLWAGDPVVVNWEGYNAASAPLLGNWSDAIFFSADDKWDIHDVRLAVVPHTGGLAQGETYAASTTVYIPGALPGSYHLLLRSDIFNQENEGPNERVKVTAFGPIPLEVHELAADGAGQFGSLSAANRAQYFVVNVAPGDSLRLNLHSQDPGRKFELFTNLGAIPTRLASDHASTRNSFDQQILLTGLAGGGAYYVLVYSDQAEPLPQFKLVAQAAPFFVDNISPTRNSNLPPEGGNPALPATTIITGVGFNTQTTIEFVDSGGTPRIPAQTRVQSSTSIAVDLDLASWPAGVYDVRVTRGTQTVTLPDAFTVTTGEPDFVARLTIPGSLFWWFPADPTTFFIDYENRGDAAMVAPVLTVAAPAGLAMTADPKIADRIRAWPQPPPGTSTNVQVIAAGSGATPGILKPGDRGRIPVYYLGSVNGREPSYTFQLRSTPSTYRSGGVLCPPENPDCTVIRWSDLKAQLRPPTIPEDAWDAIWLNLSQYVGSEWGDYSVFLANVMNQLASVGQTVTDPGRLYSFALAEASGALSPVGSLASGVDASAPAPGMPLVFSRVFGNSIVSRYRVGPLGRGWGHNWDVRIEVISGPRPIPPPGQLTPMEMIELGVRVHGPLGATRFFERNSNGTYSPSAGDHATLTKTGASDYRLVEQDQTVWQFGGAGIRLQYVEDPNGNRITLGHTGQLLTTITHSSGKQFLLDYNAAGRLWHLTDPLGHDPSDDLVTTYEYDASGEHLVKVTRPDGTATRFTYLTDPAQGLQRLHALVQVAHPDARTNVFTFDPQGRLIEAAKSCCAGGEPMTFEYPNHATVVTRDASGRRTTTRYTADLQVGQVVDDAGRAVTLSYNDNRELTSVLGPGQELYRYSYDARGNLATVTDPLHHLNAFAHEPSFNRLQTVTDARRNGLNYRYDQKGNVLAIQYADGSAEGFSYYANGLVKTSTNRRGDVINYAYNPGGQLTNKWWLTATGRVEHSYIYDTGGLLLFAIGPEGTNSMTYYPQTRRLQSITYPGGQSFVFEYDEAGRRTRRLDHDGHIVGYLYDPAGRLERMTNEVGEVIVHYQYDPSGRLQTKTLGNGVYTTYEYDAVGQLTNLVNLKPDHTLLSSYAYTYDVSGRRTSMRVNGPYPMMEGYGYDATGQLTTVTNLTLDGATVNSITEYRYDPAGNRTRVSRTGTDPFSDDYQVNNLNQYESAGAATFDYDADGNMTRKVEHGVETVYGYDAENRLASVTTPTDTWTYEYDSFGNRVATAQNDEKTSYVIDLVGLGNVVSEYDGAGILGARYEHGYGLLARSYGVGAPAYYTFSAIGHTSELTDQLGDVVNSYAHSPFGVVTERREQAPNSLQFAGEFGVQRLDIDLHWVRARHYSPRLGRFTQEDQAGLADGLNLNTFAGNNPVMMTDANGRNIIGPRPGDFPVVQPCPVRIDPCPVAVGGHGDPDDNDNWDPPEISTSTWEAPNDALKYREPTPEIPRPPPASSLPNPSNSELPPNDGTYDIWVSGMAVNSKMIDAQMTSGWTPPPASRDPNDKLWPGGVGDDQFLLPSTLLAYRIRFENMADATGPARWIQVTDVLDPNIDLDTLELVDIRFADQVIRVPMGGNHYEALVSFTTEIEDIYVDVQAKLDVASRTLTLTLAAVDQWTGLMPANPFVGILYPNDDTGRGEGSFSYIAYPKPGLPSGTVIRNQARIIFDENDPIDTPAVFNTIDSGAPSSQVGLLPANSPATFTVQWSGRDDPGGSGIDSFDVYVSDDGGPWTRWREKTTETSAIFTGQTHHTYAFYTVARDYVGNAEAAPAIADAVIFVNQLPVAGDDAMECDPDSTAKVLVAKLLANDSDPEGDVLTLTSVDAASAQGAAVSVDGTHVLYKAPAGYTGPDNFHYTIDDGFGGFSTGLVNVTVRDDNGQSPNIVKIELLDDGRIRITFIGIPNRTYGIQVTDSLTNPVWERVASRTAGENGLFTFEDDVVAGSARFYRLVWP